MEKYLDIPRDRKPPRPVRLCLIMGATGLLLMTDSASRGLALLVALLP